MRLRWRLLLLVAVVLAAALGGSFAWVSVDLREGILARVERALEVSVATFRTAEAQRARSLEVLAGWLEESSDFRNILRRTDQATLADYVEALRESSGLDLVVVTGPEGEVRAGTREPVSVEWVLEGYAIPDYWLLDGGLYQVLSVPLTGAGGVEGTLTLGYAMDLDAAAALASDTGSGVRFEAGDWSAASGSLEGRTRRLPLGPDPAAPRGHLTLAQSTEQAREFVARSQRHLVLVAAVAFLAALGASLPLIGRMANPVELLEQAQAEMDAVFAANLDGLVVLDPGGRVTLANPAAAVALGQEEEALRGRLLGEVLPKQTLSSLLAEGGHLVQRAELVREGRHYLVRRTFFRVHAGDDPGSILVLHDVTDRLDREQAVERFLEAVTPALAEHDEQAIATLVELSRLQRGTFSLERAPVRLEEVVREAGLELEVEGAVPLVEADRERLQLALRNLRPRGVVLCREGGAVRVTAEGVSGDDGLGSMALSRRIIELHGGRLERSGDRVTFTLAAHC